MNIFCKNRRTVSVHHVALRCCFGSHLLLEAHLFDSPCCVGKLCWDQTYGEEHQGALILAAPDHSSADSLGTEALTSPINTYTARKKGHEEQELEPQTKSV